MGKMLWISTRKKIEDEDCILECEWLESSDEILLKDLGYTLTMHSGV